MRAARPPLPASTCRSTALNARLVSAPTNHLKVGGVQSNTFVHGLNHGSASAAFAQNASGSRRASSIHRLTMGLISVTNEEYRLSAMQRLMFVLVALLLAGLARFDGLSSPAAQTSTAAEGTMRAVTAANAFL